MLHRKLKIELYRCTVTVFDNNEFTIDVHSISSQTETIRSVFRVDACEAFLRSKDTDYINVLVDVTQLVQNDKDPELDVPFCQTHKRCVDCWQADGVVELRVSEFSPRGVTHLVCNECEEKRGQEYFGETNYPLV